MTTAIASLRSWLGNTDGRNDADLMLPLGRELVSEIVAEHAALEAAARAVVDDMAAEGTINCPTCGAALLYQKHGRGCSLVALRALLEVA